MFVAVPMSLVWCGTGTVLRNIAASRPESRCVRRWGVGSKKQLASGNKFLKDASQAPSREMLLAFCGRNRWGGNSSLQQKWGCVNVQREWERGCLSVLGCPTAAQLMPLCSWMCWKGGKPAQGSCHLYLSHLCARGGGHTTQPGPGSLSLILNILKNKFWN